MIVVVIFIGYYIFQTIVPLSSDTEFPSSAQEVRGATTDTQLYSQTPSKEDINYEIYFTNPTESFNNTVEQALISKIDSSKTSIDMAVFEFDIEEVAQALIRAANRGVIIKIVYDNEYTDSDPQMREISTAGISVVPDNRSALMHNKFFIFDNTCVWTGSFNISNNASLKNNENAIYFCSPEAAQNYTTEFEEMYNGQFGSSSPSDTPFPTFSINGYTVENCFAPEDHCMGKVINAVNNAKSSIHFMAFSFTDGDLANVMIDDSNRGVTVEGIFETRGADAEYSECGTLLKKGYDIRLDGNPATFHHKVIIVDGKYVIFGSFNFTSSADTKNDENLLIWYDPVLAQFFEQQYQLMKSQAVVPSGETCTK